MGKNVLIILFFIGKTVLSQIPVPFYQSFDHYIDFWSVYDDNPKVLNYDRTYYDLERWVPREQKKYTWHYWNLTSDGEIISTINKTRDLKPYETIEWNEEERYGFVKTKEKKGKVLKLMTLDNYDNAGGINDTIRSRTEFKVHSRHGEGSEYYYAWSFLVPNDNNYKDEGSFQTIIAQWHEDTDVEWTVKNAQPPFFLVMENDENATDNKRNLYIIYGLRYDDNEDGVHEGDYHSFSLGKILNKGEWIDFIMKIHWSASPEKGFLEFWVNGEKIIDQGESRFYAANLYTNLQGDIHPNYLKIGQYRLGQTNRQVVYIDEFRMGKTLDQVNIRTKIKNCEKDKVFRVGDELILNEVYQAKGYQIYFINNDKIFTSKNNVFKLPNRKWIKKGEPLEIKTRLNIYNKRNKTEGFGESCFITVSK